MTPGRREFLAVAGASVAAGYVGYTGGRGEKPKSEVRLPLASRMSSAVIMKADSQLMPHPLSPTKGAVSIKVESFIASTQS